MQFGDDFPVEGATGGRLNPSEIRDALTGSCFDRGNMMETYAVLEIRLLTANRHLLFINGLLSS